MSKTTKARGATKKKPTNSRWLKTRRQLKRKVFK